jgi:CspA family cold shock protein
MAEGFVKWFNSEKGYGFLGAYAYRPEDLRVGRQDIFVHYSEIQTRGYKSLDAGEHVSFDIVRDAQGRLAARHVTQLGGQTSPAVMASYQSESTPPRATGLPLARLSVATLAMLAILAVVAIAIAAIIIVALH